MVVVSASQGSEVSVSLSVSSVVSKPAALGSVLKASKGQVTFHIHPLCSTTRR